MTLLNDVRFDSDGRLFDPATALHTTRLTPYPGDIIATKHGRGMVCGPLTRGTPEMSSFPVRYPDGRVLSQVYDGNLFTMLVPQREQSPWPMHYLHRPADLEFCWYAGTRITIRRGDSYRWRQDYEGFDTTQEDPATGEWLVTVPPTWEGLKTACDAYVDALPGGRAPDYT